MAHDHRVDTLVNKVDRLDTDATALATEFDALEQKVKVLSDALLRTAQSCLVMVDVVTELNTRLAAVETGHVYVAPTAGSLPSTSGEPMVRYHAAISGIGAGMAQAGVDAGPR